MSNSTEKATFVTDKAMANPVQMVLPNAQIQQFLVELIDQSNFPGRMADFVVHVRSHIVNAEISGK